MDNNKEELHYVFPRRIFVERMVVATTIGLGLVIILITSVLILAATIFITNKKSLRGSN